MFAIGSEYGLIITQPTNEHGHLYRIILLWAVDIQIHLAKSLLYFFKLEEKSRQS